MSAAVAGIITESACVVFLRNLCGSPFSFNMKMPPISKVIAAVIELLMASPLTQLVISKLASELDRLEIPIKDSRELSRTANGARNIKMSDSARILITVSHGTQRRFFCAGGNQYDHPNGMINKKVVASGKINQGLNHK